MRPCKDVGHNKYKLATFCPPLKQIGGCCGLYLEAPKGNMYFTELPERVECGDFEKPMGCEIHTHALALDSLWSKFAEETCMHIYIYIYIEREREIDRYIRIHIYIYIYIYSIQQEVCRALRGRGTANSDHNISLHKVFSKAWVARAPSLTGNAVRLSKLYAMCAKIFQGWGPLGRKSCAANWGYGSEDRSSTNCTELHCGQAANNSQFASQDLRLNGPNPWKLLAHQV